jgi:PAS domain S-box-containing protein
MTRYILRRSAQVRKGGSRGPNSSSVAYIVRKRIRICNFWRCACFALATLLVSESPVAAQVKQIRRVVILNDLGIISSPGFAEVDQAIFAGLQKSPYQIELYHESLEITLFPDEVSQGRFRQEFIQKYSDRRPDVIIAVGSASFKFIAESQERFLRDTPVIFCAILGKISEEQGPDMHFTGVLGQLHPEATLTAALHMLPNTKHVVVTGGMGPFDEGFEEIAKQGFRNLESKLEFTYLTKLSMPTLLEQLKHLSSDTIVYHTAMTKDAAGQHFIDSAQAVPLVASAANAPVFVMDDVDLREGTVGGDLVNWSDDGHVAAEMAVRVLNGEKAEDIPIVTSDDAYMFDWRALRRWGIKENSLPPGSMVINREPSFWELYRRYVIAGVFVLLGQTGVILGLLWQRSRRKKTQRALSLVNEQLRLAMDASKAVGWHLDLKTRDNTWFGDLENMFGLPSDIFSTEMGEFFRYVHPGDRQLVSDGLDHARTHREPHAAEFRVIRRDGVVRWIASRGKFEYAADGKATRMMGMAVDVTDRKLADEKIRESEQRFRLVANTAPVMIWTSGVDKLCTYFNQPWLDFTGRSLEQELGNGWSEGVHAEDLDRCLRTYVDCFDARESFEMEYRLRRHDGEYRWVVDLGVPRFNPDGSFAGYIGSCIDVTERKLAEEALSTVSRRLIEAHEEERVWVARELHDDVNQRLALIAVNLDVLKRELPQSATEAWLRLSEVRQQIKDLGIDVQALSHRLHSSKLKYLGLTAAVTAFCREFSERKSVQIDLQCDSVPRTVPDEVSLCLFRVLQEALQNASKYSGSQHYQVSVKYTGNELSLTVSDSGVGFNPHLAMQGRGLGITSMRERLKLVDGELSIESGSPQGALVRARVPLPLAAVKSASAGKL